MNLAILVVSSTVSIASLARIDRGVLRLRYSCSSTEYALAREMQL
jgi:hypothetical protein